MKEYMKKTGKTLRTLAEKIFGMKLRYRMMLLYFVGGALPVILIGMYLINGTNHILVKQAKSTEITEIEMVRQQAQELLSTVNMVSKYFIFDEKLEAIALKEYTDYQEMVTDYRNYNAFVQYGNYYNNIISWISVYMENETIRGNAHFVKVNDDIREQHWYVQAKEKNGAAFWQYLPVSTGAYESLALTRLVSTKKGQRVGVLVLHIRPERLQEIIEARDYDTMIVLNGDTVVAERSRNEIPFAQIQGKISADAQKTRQEEIEIDGKVYVATCAGLPVYESGDRIEIISLRSKKDILGEADKQNRQSIVFFALSAGASILMILAFSWSFGKKVGCFHAQMQRAAAGEFDLIERLEGNDEISELYDYLGTMITEIRRLLTEVYRERLRAEQLKSEQKNAEFKMLASQINPHFLYNTLETIRMKARVNGQYDIERLVKMLAKILRKNIQAGSQDVTLKTELDLIECYLEIQKYRFGDRIQYQIRMEDGLESYQVFPLLLQPIVENSIIHGLEIKEGTGHIEIRIERAAGCVRITVSDDGVGMEKDRLEALKESMHRESEDHAHIGIGNVHRRIRLRYGEAYGIQIDSRINEGTRVIFLLPEQNGDREEKERYSQTGQNTKG